MKTNCFLLPLLLALALTGCLSQKYLPKPKEMGANPYGSHIRITTSMNHINGELIAVDSSSLYVKMPDTAHVTTVSKNDIENYSLHVATMDQNIWMPFVFPLMSISHGGYALLTLPINVPASLAIAQGGFTLREKDITFDQLQKFSRFPQGLPPDLPLSEIR